MRDVDRGESYRLHATPDLVLFTNPRTTTWIIGKLAAWLDAVFLNICLGCPPIHLYLRGHGNYHEVVWQLHERGCLNS